MDTNKPNQTTSLAKTGANANNGTETKLTAKDWLILLAIIGGIWAFFAINKKSYEEYDLKGLTAAEACEKARSAGWEVNSVRHVDYYNNSDKTDCYNTNVTITDYDYNRSDKKVDIEYGTKKTKEELEAEEEAKKAEEEAKKAKEKADQEAACVAEGKVYRSSGECKSAEEWAAQDKKEAAEAEARAKAAAEASKRQSSNSSSTSSGSSSSSSSSTTRIDPNQSYVLATIGANEKCPSNVKFCNISGNSTGSATYGYGTMKGQLINNTNKDYSYVQITAEVYNSAGSKVGDCWGNTSGLKAGTTWQYEAYCSGWAANGSLKNGQVSGW